MTHSFNVYIDESGDDGIGKFRQPGADGGASRWLTIGACVVRTSRDLELVGLRDEIRKECRPKSKTPVLHFKDLNHSQRRRACQMLAMKPLRIVCVLGLKDAPAAERFKGKNQLYFYLTRYVIERVSWLCRDYRSQVKEGDGRAKIVFSRRGGMNYDDFRDYLKRLKDSDETEIYWPVIDIDAVEAQDHSRLAALQLADIAVSGITAAIERDPFGNVEGGYLAALKPNIYSRNGNYLSYGLKTLPNLNDAELDNQQLDCFKIFR